MLIFLNLRKFGLKPTLLSRHVSGEFLSNAKAWLGSAVAKVRAGGYSKDKWQAHFSGMKLSSESLARKISVVLVMSMTAIAAYWVMKIAQIPFPAPVSAKGVVFYSAASDSASRALFGEKSFDASRVVLRGIVITGSEGGANQGMALIEVDGKTAEAMSVGEMVPPGIRLEKIQPDGAVVTYQGKEISLQQSFDSAAGKSQ